MGNTILTSALIGAVIGALVVIIFGFVSSRRKGSFDVKVNRSGVVDTTLAPDEALRRIEAAATQQGLTVEQVDTAGQRILLSEGLGFSSFGHFFPISVAATEGGGSAVTVGLKTKVPQYGPVVGRNHRKIMEKVRSAVSVS